MTDKKIAKIAYSFISSFSVAIVLFILVFAKIELEISHFHNVYISKLI